MTTGLSTASNEPGGAPKAAGSTTAIGGRKYRPELQGLRAVAALLVVLYHLWFGRVSGGVDVFFVISGFLITGQLARAVDKGGIAFRPMWGRMIKRLLPAAFTVLLAVMVAGFVLLPQGRWFQTIREVVASALYMENWQLVADSANYFAQHNQQSPVQHFWSLSIQGQFYVLWPLLVLLVAVVARKLGARFRRTLAVSLAAVFVISLGYSVYATAAYQQVAYFSSLTRIWEFALGGLLGLTVDRIRLPRMLRIPMGWIGLAGLISCGLILQIGQVFPGYAALWPTMSAVFVIAAGATTSVIGADRILSSKPLEYLGNLSYAMYLWHWPVLVFYLVARDRVEVGFRGGTALLVLSVLLSMATYHLVEKPVRTSQIGVQTRWGAYRFAVVALVPVLAMAGSWQYYTVQQAQAVQLAVNDADHPGAMSQTEAFRYEGTENPKLVPSYAAIREDWAESSLEQCRTSDRNEELEVCSNAIDGEPSRSVVVVGDSHSQQLVAGLKPLAEKRGWKLTTMLRGACPFSTASEVVPGSQGCIDWNTDALAEISEMQPDVVVTLASRNVRRGLKEETPDGFVQQWRSLMEVGVPVLAVRDNPRYDFAPSACAEKSGVDAANCSTPVEELYPQPAPYEARRDIPDNVTFFDIRPFVCAEETCPPTLGNVLVYLDDNHLSATYVQTMSPLLANAVEESLEDSPVGQ